MVTKKEQLWQQLPLPDLSSPVLALTVERDQLRAGGAGGIASYALVGTHNAWLPGVAALPLSSVTALLALDGVLLAGGSEGIAYSFTGGESWQQAELEDGVAAIMALAASPAFANDRTALAATLENGLLRSTDGGRTWMNASFGLESLEVSTLIWANDQTLLAAARDGIYRSRDAGRAWRLIYAAGEDEAGAIEALAVLPDGTFLAGLESGALLFSRDQGRNWRTGAPVQSSPTLSLYVTSTGAVLWGTFDGLWRSDDAGASWQMVHAQTVEVCVEHAQRIYAGHVSGVSASDDDGRTWRELSCPPLSDLRVMLASTHHLLLAGTYAGLARSTPGGWSLLPNVPPALTTCRLLAPDILLLSAPTGLGRLSLADGTYRMLLAGEVGHVAHIATRQVDEHLAIWLASSDGKRLLHSTDDGENWQALPTPFGILPLVAFEFIADRLLAATYDPRQYQVCLWYSTDGGRNWIRSLEAGTRWPVVATCAQPAAVSIGNILFLEERAGQWQNLTVGHDGGAIRRLVSLSLPGKTLLFALTTTGIQCSEDLGATWRQENEGLPVEQIVDLASTNTTLFVLLTGGRVWQRELA